VCVAWITLAVRQQYAESREIPDLETKFPDEANRISQRSGLSIIKPSGWLHEVHSFKDGSLGSITVRSSKRKFASSYSFTNASGPPRETDDLRPIAFDGRSAVMEFNIYPTEAGDRSSGNLYFQDGDEWFLVQFGLQGTWDEPPRGFMRYLQTARTDRR